MKHIDVTPTWEQAVHIYLMVLENGTDNGKASAREELLRLARNYDQLTAELKKEPAQ